jgi:FlaA1/EpsC-like NDP-sugar epimerase
LPEESLASIIAGIFAVLGHNYTCWLKFKGGKGIATTAGVYLALAPWALLVALVVFILAVLLTRYVSVGSIAAAIALPVTVWIMTPHNLFLGIVTTALGALAIYKHKSNIQRLMAGTENRLGKKRRNEMRITVFGAGAWGTALAKVLHENGNAVTLWDINAALLGIQRGRSEKYLPGVALPTDWKTEPDFAKAIGGARSAGAGDSVAGVPRSGGEA